MTFDEAVAARRTTGPASPMRVLMLEDSAHDAELIERHLREAGLNFTCRRAETAEAFAQQVHGFLPDVILMDCVIPGACVLKMLQRARTTLPHVPVIIVTGVLLDALVARLLNAGAVDYLLKDRLARLGSAVRRAVAEARVARRLVRELAA